MRMPTNTPFRSEKDLVDSFKAILPVALGHQGGESIVLQEASICGVVPDFLVGRWIGSVPDFPKKPLTSTEVHVLAALQYSGEMTLRDLTSKLYLSEVTACKCIHRLRRVGFLAVSDTERITALDVGGTTSIEITAIEMKLNRWREALEQTKRYRSFADRCYAVFDGAQLKLSTEMLESFRAAGIGLMLQSGETIQQLCPAVTSLRFSTQRLKAAQKLWRESIFTNGRVFSSV